MKEELVISRKFKAPKELVFAAFTQKEHLQQWWGPGNGGLNVLELNVTPGGKFHYSMKGPDGKEMFGLFNYKEIDAPHKIVFTSAFSDENGNVVSHAMAPDFPREIHNTWTFEDENGETILTLRGFPQTEDEKQISFFNNFKENINGGFKHTFDNLEAYIAAKFKLQQEYKTTSNARTSSYLNFNGNTEQAFNFYKSVFKTEFIGGKIKKFDEVPPMEGQPPLTEEMKNFVLHAQLPITGGHIIMATDAPESMGFTLNTGNNMHINLEPESREEADRLFAELSVNGTITMPLEDMFFGSYFGSLTDQFGINWMITYTKPQ